MKKTFGIKVMIFLMVKGQEEGKTALCQVMRVSD